MKSNILRILCKYETMILTYKECFQTYKTDYEIRKALLKGELRRVSRGFYSNEPYDSELSVISRMYPHAVFTMNSAFYYHGLTDDIPSSYYLMTDKDATKINNKLVKQFYDNNNSLSLGVEKKEYDGTEISIFNRERMLIELMHNKNKLSFDYYKEIVASYRRIINELDIQAVQDYAKWLPKTRLVMDTIQMEIF